MVEKQLHNCPERLQIVGSGDDQSAILTFLDGSVEQFDDDRNIAENVSRLVGELLGEELYQQFRSGTRDENLNDLVDVVERACLPGFCKTTARFYAQRQFRNRIAESQEA